jgi:hypothetical protein
LFFLRAKKLQLEGSEPIREEKTTNSEGKWCHEGASGVGGSLALVE